MAQIRNMTPPSNSAIRAARRGVNQILAPNQGRIHVESISISAGASNVAVGETMQLALSFIPDNASVKTGTWSSSSAAGTVSDSGLFTGVSAGSATVTFISDDDGVSASIAMTVTAE